MELFVLQRGLGQPRRELGQKRETGEENHGWGNSSGCVSLSAKWRGLGGNTGNSLLYLFKLKKEYLLMFLEVILSLTRSWW